VWLLAQSVCQKHRNSAFASAAFLVAD